MYITEILISSRNKNCLKTVLEILENATIKDYLYNSPPEIKINEINPLSKYTTFFQVEILTKLCLRNKIKTLLSCYFTNLSIYPSRFYKENTFSKCKIFIDNTLIKNDITFYQIKSYYKSIGLIQANFIK